jgi:hypothetical protein
VGTIDSDSLIIIELGEGQVRSHVKISSLSSDAAAQTLEQSLKSLADHGQSALVAIAVTEDEGHASSILHQAHTLAESSDVHVLDLLHMFGSRWRSLLCEDDSCCPKSGHLLDDGSQIAFSESSELDELPREGFQLHARSLDDDELRLRNEAFASADSWPTGSPIDLLEFRDTKVTEVMNILSEAMFEGMCDFWVGAATVGNALLDIRARDGVLRRILEHEELRGNISENLATLFRVAPIECRPAIATVFAGARWLEGDQLATRYAIDIALEEDSEYSLARLLDTALIHGVPHRVWIDSLTAVPYEKCLAGAA